jgi:hypothetical protein
MKYLLFFLFLLPICAQAQFDMTNMQAPPSGPVITRSPVSLDLGTNTTGSAGTPGNITYSAVQLTANLSITFPSSWAEASTDGGSTWTSTSPITISPVGGSVNPANPLKLRVKSTTAAGAQSGTVSFSSTGATTQSTNLTATVSAAPTLSATTPLTLTGTAGSAGTAVTSTITFSGLSSGVLITAPTSPIPLEVSLDGVSFATTQTTPNSSPQTVYVRTTAAATAGTQTENVVLSASGASPFNIVCNITVNSATVTQYTVNLWDSVRNSGKYTADATWPQPNNWAPTGTTGLTSRNLVSTTGTASGISLTLNTLNDYVTNSVGYGSGNSLGFPQGVWVASAYSTTSPTTLTLGGLSPSHTYGIQILTTTNQASGPFNCVWTTGAQSTGTINSFNSTASTVVLAQLGMSTHLTPNGSNQIVITATPSNGFVVFTGIIIYEY